MPEETVKNPSEEFTVEDVERTFERDLEKFKRKVDQLFSE